MITDRPPRSRRARQQFDESDALTSLGPLPDARELQTCATLFAKAVGTGDARGVKGEGESVLELLARTYGVSRPTLRVLGARPRSVWEGGHSELFGDYDFEEKRIRIWMRTAVLGKVTSYRGLLHTLLHEFCHHLDREGLGFPDTPHSWDPVRPALAAAGFRAVSPFLRGYAPTEIPSAEAYDMETLGRDALALIAALGEDRAVLVGHDWGAVAAYAAAGLEPARLRALVTIAIPHPAAIVPTPRLVWAFRHFFALRRRGAAARIRRDGFAYLDEFFTGRVMKREPRATVDAVRMGKKKMFASSAKAERDLGWRVVPVDAALRRACEWFITHGYVEGVRELAAVSS